MGFLSKFRQPTSPELFRAHGNPEIQQILARLTAIEQLLEQLTTEVKTIMSDNQNLDQATADLGTAVTNKLAEDATLRTEAAAGRNESADIAKVQAITDQLNAETAAEQAEDTAANPAPVTVTGTTAAGVSVPEAPVDTSAAAPTTQVVDTSKS